jgi:hypothetical protein
MTKKPLSEIEEAEMLEMLSDFHNKGEDGNDTSFQRMSRCERYGVGQQWTKEVLDVNKARRKFSITINRLLPIINQLSGFDARNPKDMKVRCLRSGTQKGAEILSALAKHTVDLSHAIRQQNQCFEDGIRCARGYIEADVSYDEDPLNGDISIRKLDPFMVIPDPACKSYDYNDLKNGAKYIIVEEWVDKGYIIKKYPKSKDSLGDVSETGHRYDGPFSGLVNALFGGSDNTTKTSYRDSELGIDKADVDFEEHKFRVAKYYWKTFEKGALLVKDNDQLNAITLTEPKDIAFAKKGIERQRIEQEQQAQIQQLQQQAMAAQEQAAQQAQANNLPDILGQPDRPEEGDTLDNQGQPTAGQRPLTQEPQPPEYTIIEEDRHGNPIIVPVLHRAYMVGSVMLEYQKDPFKGMNLFPIVRFSPYFVSGYEFSVIENLIGSQDRVNWAASMELNLIRKLANAGWKIAKDVGGKWSKWLQDHGSEDGIVIDESNFGNKVEKLEPNQLPTGYSMIRQTATEDISGISQVQLKADDDNQSESGRAVLAKQNWSTQNTSNIGSNWDFTQELLGEIVLGIIRNAEVYSESEVLALVDEEDLIDEEIMNQARQHVIETLAKKGMPVVQQPEKPDLMLLQGENPAYQQAVLYNYKKSVEIFQEYMVYVDQLATPVAKAMIIDEISSMKYGKYGVKVELSPHAETNRMKKMVEVFELNRALQESGQLPISRNMLIDATDVANKDELKADLPQMPAPTGGSGGGVPQPTRANANARGAA